MDTLSRLIKRLEAKHGHGKHSPEHGGGAGQGAAPPFLGDLAKVLSDPGDGASVFPRGKAPPLSGVHILAAGNPKNAKGLGNVYPSHGLWTSDSGEQFVEPSFYVHRDASGPDEVMDVVRGAEKLRQKNKQESVGVVVRRDPAHGALPGFDRARAYRLRGPNGSVELIDPSQHKLHMVHKILGGKGKVQVAMSPVQVRWLSGGELEKDYSSQAQADARVAREKHPAKPRKDSGVGLKDYYMRSLDTMIAKLEDPVSLLVKQLEGEVIWEREMKAICKAYDRNGDVVVECGGEYV